jgi:hypothetical protein
MSKFLCRFLLLLVFAVTLPGCSLFHKKKPQSSAHIYEGDSPDLHFTDRPEKPGGEVNPY